MRMHHYWQPTFMERWVVMMIQIIKPKIMLVWQPLVDISGKGVVSNPKLAKEVGKKLAMHIVAAKPTYLKISNIPTELVEKEKELLKSQIVDSKKPPEVIERIINGRMKKFYSDICLVEQEHFVEEGNQKVSKVLADHGLAVNSFQLLSI